MTDRKKDYILEALGEVEDAYIEEAVTYRRARKGWHYGREFSSLAACLAVLAVAGLVYKYVPIRNTTDNAVKQEGMQESDIRQPQLNQSNSTVCTDQTADVTYTMIFTENVAEPEDKNSTYEINDKKDGPGNLLESVGNQSGSVGPIDHQQNIQQENTSVCLKWMSAEEILAQELDVFVGTVTERTVYQMTSGQKSNFTVLTVQVEDSIKGSAQVSQSYTIYLPVGVGGEVVTDSSISGDLLQLKVGSRAVFMPYKCSSESGRWIDGMWHGYGELAQYYMSEGIRHLMLETEEGLRFAKDVYKVEGGSKASLYDAAEYLRELVNNIEK